MSTIANFLALCTGALGRIASAPLVARASGTSTLTALSTEALGGLSVEYPAGATVPLPTGAATQATIETPTIPTQITASDDTDTSTLTSKGLLVETAGDLAVRGTGAPTVTVTITVVAGQYVPIHCSRVMAATTASVVGLS